MNIIKNISLIIPALILMSLLTACGGNNNVIGDQASLTGSNTVIPETVKIENGSEETKISYQTSTPVKKASIVTSNFSFNNVPLWSEFHEVKTSDGINHTAILKTKKKGSFMIYASPQDRFDNGGRGIELK